NDDEDRWAIQVFGKGVNASSDFVYCDHSKSSLDQFAPKSGQWETFTLRLLGTLGLRVKDLGQSSMLKTKIRNSSMP
ncbi:hypothetical protein MJO29_000661, partial [Puccinia striiformis f. sp. tritici]